MNTETIADIVHEMRNRYFIGHERMLLDEFAYRIEDAHKRETERLTAAYNNAVTADVNHAMEIERMRRALKPVLAVHLCDGGQQVVSDALCAIREAQEIMKGETK